LGSIEQCKSYTGLPTGWLKNTTAGMVFIPDGHFNFGSEKAYPDELNFGKNNGKLKVSGLIKLKSLLLSSQVL
jgi:hypothetical protein